MPNQSPYSNPLYVLEELVQALKSDDAEIMKAVDRFAALTGIQREHLLNMALAADSSISEVNSITDAVIHLDKDLNILSWNPAAERIYGYSKNEAVDKNVEELLKTEYELESRQQSLESFRDHGMWTGEINHRCKDGKRIPVYVQISYTHDSRGLVTGMAGTFRDLSGSLSSGNVPELMTTRLRTMLKTTSDAIWDWDIKSNRYWWSEGIERLFGHVPDDLEPGPESWYNRIHPDDKKRVIEDIHLAINGTATNWQDDYKFLKKDGTWAYVIDRAYIIRDSQGMAIRVIGGLSDRTEQRKMIYDLAEAHKKIKIHIRNSPLAVIEWDAGLNLTSWNQQAEAIFGWKADEVIGKNPNNWNFIYEDDKEYVNKKMQDLMSGKVISNVVMNRNYCREADVAFCEWYNSSIVDDEGKPVSILSMAHDVTGREMAIRKLEQSEARLSHARSIARLGDWQLDIETGRLDWSDEVYTIFGIDKNDFSGTYEAYIDRVHPDDREKVDQVKTAALKNQGPTDLMHRIILPVGEVRHLHQRGELIRDDQGMAVKLVGTVQDITQLAEAQQKLRKSEEMYRTIVDTAHEGIWLIDFNGDTTYVNQRMADILGYSTDEMLGRRFSEFVDDSKIEQAHDEFEKRKKGEEIKHDILMKHNDGRPVWIMYYGNPIFDDKGNFVAALAMVTDITGKKLDEEALASSVLEKQVMLEEIHHRVKNNMQLISSLMQLQSMNVTDETVKTLFEDSQSRILSMALVHENLYQTENMSSIDFGDYLEKLVVNLKDAYARMPLTVRVESNTVALSVDKAIPLGLIVNELITNSICHAFPGESDGTVLVKLMEEEEEEKAEAEVEVEVEAEFKTELEAEIEAEVEKNGFEAESKTGEIGGDGDSGRGFTSSDNGEGGTEPERLNGTRRYLLIVEDNGVGFSRNTTGKSDGIGMELIDGLVKQIKGSIAFSSAGGTRVELRFMG